ncbi:MAG: ABC transporter ATP-binding protein, partial [Panacibacter sp.]
SELQRERQLTYLIISHDLSILRFLSHRLAIMYMGQLVEWGPTQEIYERPQHPYTKALLACRPVLHNKNERLPVVSDFMETDEAEMIVETINTNEKLRINNEQLIIDPPLIKVENLKVWYPAHKTFTGKITAYNKAVNNVSFEIYKGETLGLVGESGCGKTTLGRCLLGLIPPAEGNILFDNKDISKAKSHELRLMRKEMQIIFQDPYSSLNPRKKIGEAIAEPLKVHRLFATEKQRKEKVMELLKKVNLSADHYNRYPHEFSGGQRQRIVIARALVLQPKFVVCDESVSALDVSVQAQILNLLNDLKKEFNFTALFISHDLSVIRYISDRIMVMNKGVIEETGYAEDLYLHPQKEYTKQLIASIPGIIYGPNI